MLETMTSLSQINYKKLFINFPRRADADRELVASMEEDNEREAQAERWWESEPSNVVGGGQGSTDHERGCLRRRGCEGNGCFLRM